MRGPDDNPEVQNTEVLVEEPKLPPRVPSSAWFELGDNESLRAYCTLVYQHGGDLEVVSVDDGYVLVVASHHRSLVRGFDSAVEKAKNVKRIVKRKTEEQKGGA